MPPAQKDFLALTKERKCIYEFSSRKVSDSHITSILEAARWAPSFLNSQPWSFIVVRNKETISRLIDICYYGYFHSVPPVMVVIVLEPSRFKELKALKDNTKDFIDWHQLICIGMPVISMQFAATSLGIGSCILSLPPEEANKLLKVKGEGKALLTLGLGYEKRKAYKKPRERKSLKDFVHDEQYGRKK